MNCILSVVFCGVDCGDDGFGRHSSGLGWLVCDSSFAVVVAIVVAIARIVRWSTKVGLADGTS